MAAGREGRIFADVCQLLDLEVLGFLDDTRPRDELVNDLPVLGGFDCIDDENLVKRASWIVGLGNNEIRRRLLTRIRERGGTLATIIHPTCLISPSAEIGRGVLINAFSRVLPNARVGDYALIEGLASIGADSITEEGAFIGPGCNIAGASHIGTCAFIGIGATLSEKVTVGAYSVIGAGAVVASDIPEGVLAVGVPAVVKRKL
jgi:sugar O-acyltransferase (sialic acid O-acetyltransferase NeuD family)